MLSALGHLLALATKTQQANDSFTCDSPPPMATQLDATRYMGKWYGQKHTANQAHQSDLDKCVTVEYTDLDSEGNFKVYNSSHGRYYWIPRFGVHGQAKCPSDQGSGQCFVRFFAPLVQWTDDPNYLILDTDYDTYSIVYSCDGESMLALWIMTREPQVSTELLDTLTAKAFSLLPTYPQDQLISDIQTDQCTY